MQDFPIIPVETKFTQWYSNKLKATRFTYDLEGLELTFRYADIKDLVATGVIPIPLIEYVAQEIIEGSQEPDAKSKVVKYLTDVAKSKELFDSVVKACLIDPLELKNYWDVISYSHLEAIYARIISGGEGAANLKSSTE